MTSRSPIESALTPGEGRPFDAKSYWEARLRTHPGLSGVGHTRLGKRYIHWLYKVRRAVFLRLLRSLRLDLRMAQVFDVGSGTGFYLELWRELGVQSVAGCDFTEIAVSRLENAFPGSRIVRMDISGALPPAAGEQYDVVSAFDVLFHIVGEDRYWQAIRNVHALLRSGGLFVFSDFLVHGKPRTDEHLVCRELKQVEVLLAETGFDMVCRVPMFVLMEEPLDSTSPVYRYLWKLITYPVRQSDFAGSVIGRLLYPLELFLTKILRESPTIEIIACRKRSGEKFAGWREREPHHVASHR